MPEPTTIYLTCGRDTAFNTFLHCARVVGLVSGREPPKFESRSILWGGSILLHLAVQRQLAAVMINLVVGRRGRTTAPMPLDKAKPPKTLHIVETL